MSQPAVELTSSPLVTGLSSGEREHLQGRARLLAWTGNAWHLIEFGVALGAGIAAGSIALVGFGADSLIEALSGFVIIWLFTGGRLHSSTAEQRAQRLIALSYFVLATYIVVESLRDLAAGRRPTTSSVRIGL